MRQRRGTRGRLVTALVALVAGAALLPLLPATAAPNGYVEMSDGVLIAVNVRPPRNFVEGRRYPAVFEMSGYDGGSASDQTLMGDIADAFGYEGEVPLREDSRQLTHRFEGDYFTIHASVRGTGCSGGTFDLFSWRAALDGHEVIEWIARQPWSDGNVALMGHSYGGITGFMIAATRPPHLRAATLSGLIDDLYRGITYPGGVSNYGFPLAWTGVIRPFYDLGGGLAPGIVRTQDPVCAQNQASKNRTVLEDPIVNGVGDTDSNWWRSRSLISYVHLIDVPMHITGAYQDEQTGPRGPFHLFEKLPTHIPRRLVMTNGDHGTQQGPDAVWDDRVAWVDQFTRGLPNRFDPIPAPGGGTRAHSSTRVLLELHSGVHEGSQGTHDERHPNGVVDKTAFPLENTQWTDLYLRGGGALSTTPPAEAEEPARYVSGSGRQSWSYQAGPAAGSELSTPDGPDEAVYATPAFTQDVLIAGPMAATLFVDTTAPDTELFVQLIDEGPDGSRSYLQRGMLRASHRALNVAMSDKTADGRIYRPFHPHTNPTPVVPGQVNEYVVEIFPVGHVLRAGHRLVVKVHAPPRVDSFNAYVPRYAPSVNTIHHGPRTPSRLLLPVVPLAGVRLGPEIACGRQEAVRCVPGGADGS
ncbi:MAG TPA: CocE/NonD family hydrolase [Egibacteraceae bacterium]|nr:CocE/NonD family hydrolase [Egibacteraceae bacterium]